MIGGNGITVHDRLREWGQWKRDSQWTGDGLFKEYSDSVKVDDVLRSINKVEPTVVSVITEIYVFEWSIKKIARIRRSSQYSVKSLEFRGQDLVRRRLS